MFSDERSVSILNCHHCLYKNPPEPMTVVEGMLPLTCHHCLYKYPPEPMTVVVSRPVLPIGNGCGRRREIDGQARGVWRITLASGWGRDNANRVDGQRG